MRTLVSKKLPGIRLVPVELEIGGKAPSKGAKPLQQFRAAGLARDGEFPRAGDMDFDLVALLESQRRDHGGGKTDGETVAPFGDLHGARSERYTIIIMYIQQIEMSTRRVPWSPALG